MTSPPVREVWAVAKAAWVAMTPTINLLVVEAWGEAREWEAVKEWEVAKEWEVEILMISLLVKEWEVARQVVWEVVIRTALLAKVVIRTTLPAKVAKAWEAAHPVAWVVAAAEMTVMTSPAQAVADLPRIK